MGSIPGPTFGQPPGLGGWDRLRRRIGGHLKALEIGPSGRIFAGSLCGVFELDYSAESGSP